MLQESTLFGDRDKVSIAIDRIRTFCAGKRVLCAFSGGKDSQVCYHLLRDSGVDFHAEYSVTRFEPPELVAFVRKHYADATFRRAYKMTLLEEIGLRGLPNRWARWCCNAKHVKTNGFDIAVLGIRWEESAKRRNDWRMFGYKKDKTAYICPIVDWRTADVWEYLGSRPHCSLYDEGFSRIGCVCCPLSPAKMQADALRWPKTCTMLRKGSDLFVNRMRARGWITATGKTCAGWHLAEDPNAEYFRRWITTGQTSRNYEADEDDDNCIFSGSGFSESDEASEETGE